MTSRRHEAHYGQARAIFTDSRYISLNRGITRGIDYIRAIEAVLVPGLWLGES
jgi:hypothetical protein